MIGPNEGLFFCGRTLDAHLWVLANRIRILTGGFCIVGFLLHFVYVFAHAGGLFRIRVCLFSRAPRARRTAAHSPKLCPALAFAVWPAIARPALRAARGVGDSLNGQKHQKRDDGDAHWGLSSLGVVQIADALAILPASGRQR
jgi:hypothetical protein